MREQYSCQLVSNRMITRVQVRIVFVHNLFNLIPGGFRRLSVHYGAWSEITVVIGVDDL